MFEKDTKQLEELLYKILSAGNAHRKLMGDILTQVAFVHS